MCARRMGRAAAGRGGGCAWGIRRDTAASWAGVHARVDRCTSLGRVLLQPPRPRVQAVHLVVASAGLWRVLGGADPRVVQRAVGVPLRLGACVQTRAAQLLTRGARARSIAGPLFTHHSPPCSMSRVTPPLPLALRRRPRCTRRRARARGCRRPRTTTTATATTCTTVRRRRRRRSDIHAINTREFWAAYNPIASLPLLVPSSPVSPLSRADPVTWQVHKIETSSAFMEMIACA